MNEEGNKKLKDVSFYTLRIALKSYFSTYQSMNQNFNIFKKDGSFIESQEYIESYISVIIHFHRFFELFIKSILRDVDELMVVEFINDPYILYKLIKQEGTGGTDEDRKINTIGF